MAELSNPQLVNLSNEYARPVADDIAALDVLQAATLATYAARDLGTIINAGGAGELVADGSVTDGRTRVTGGDVFNLITLLTDLNTFLAASGRRDVIAKWQVNGVKP